MRRDLVDLGHPARLVTRYEYHIESFLGMVRLACIKLLLGYLLDAESTPSD